MKLYGVSSVICTYFLSDGETKKEILQDAIKAAECEFEWSGVQEKQTTYEEIIYLNSLPKKDHRCTPWVNDECGGETIKDFFENQTKEVKCSLNKTVEINGKKYKLTEVNEC